MHHLQTCILAPLYLMHPGTVVSVVNSYAATSEYTPAKLDNRVDLPTDGNPTNPIRASPVLATSKPDNNKSCFINHLLRLRLVKALYKMFEVSIKVFNFFYISQKYLRSQILLMLCYTKKT